MKINKQYHDLLNTEFNQVIEKMQASKSADETLYYFSALYGTINRIMNFEYDPILVFVHQEIQAIHQNFIGRLAQNIAENNASYMGTPVIFLESLIKYSLELRDAFVENSDEKIRQILQKFAVLSYATTGNGYYLYLRGRLGIPE
jgi:hypothetical protein